MSPDIEELIKKVNTLTLDKNRLRQKLTQISQNGNQQQLNRETITNSNLQSSSLTTSQSSSQLNQSQCSPECDSSPKSVKNSINARPLGDSFCSSKSSNSNSNHIIAGVECSTSCEEDLLFMNQLYKRRLDEYNEKWDFIQSKCTALVSELNALQKHFIYLKKEKLEIQERFNSKCDDYDKIQNELQTVVLNYETQLSTMSEHLTMITNQASLEDKLARV